MPETIDKPRNKRAQATKSAKKPKARPPEDALALLGIRSWAHDLDVVPETALAMVAAMLTGVAGPDAWLELSWGPVPLPKLDILTDKSHSAVMRLIDCLAGPVRQLNRRLAQKMRVHSPAALEFCTAGPFAGSGQKLATPDMVVKTIDNHWQALTRTPGPGENGMLHQDLAFDPVPERMEAITHPDFVLENARGRDLASLVDNCHGHAALVIRPVLPLDRAGVEPYQAMNQLTALLDGTIVRKRDPGGCQQARAVAILALAQADIGFLANAGQPLLSRLLWVGTGGAKEDAHVTVQAGSRDAASRRFFDAYRQALDLILDVRRQGRTPLIRLADSTAFETKLRQYRADLDQWPTDPGISARGLPETLLWTMGFLRLALPSDRRSSDESLVKAAFGVARQLAECHVREMTKQDDVRQSEASCVFAGQIVALVSQHAPMVFRDLARSFRKQRKERFVPVIDTLVDARVLSRDERGRLNPGPVALPDVMEEIVERLSARQCPGNAEPAQEQVDDEDPLETDGNDDDCDDKPVEPEDVAPAACEAGNESPGDANAADCMIDNETGELAESDGAGPDDARDDIAEAPG